MSENPSNIIPVERIAESIFLIRKDLIHHVNTAEASYVEGQDFTLIGSRSGANAIGAWMILSKYGPHGWFEKILILQNRTKWLSGELSELGIKHFRSPYSNIVTIEADQLDEAIVDDGVMRYKTAYTIA